MTSKKKNERDLLDKIIEAKAILGNNVIESIVNHLNIDEYDEKTQRGSCPFHAEKTPSFMWNEKEYYFKCFGCGAKYGVVDLYNDLEGTYSKALIRLFKEAGLSDYGAIFENKKDYFRNYKYPITETNQNRSNVEKYFELRGISIKTLDHFGIKEDNHGNVVFEFKDVYGKHVGSKYRLARKQKDNKEPKTWWQKDASKCPTLFGIEKVDITKPLLITEGMIDAMSCYESGYFNVVSIDGGANDLNWIEFNYEFLEHFEDIILWYDNDTAGRKGLEEVIARLGEYRCKIVTPDTSIEDLVAKYYQQYSPTSDIRKTDANNVLLGAGKQVSLSLINGAEEIPSKKLKFLMDFETTNVKDMEKCSTGILALDKLIFGSLFPCFTIYTGETGAGKSTLANIVSVIAPIENGHKAFIFSGELDNGQLSDWLVTPFAGNNHIIRWRNENQRDGFSTSTEAEKCIKEHYRKNILVYDDEDGLDSSGDAIIKEMEMAYKKHGCRVFLIDNLMCVAMDSGDSDSKWDQQKKFIIKIMAFTKKYKVCTNLIVHPRKPTQGVTTRSAYDIAGTSDIVNLCHRLIWIERVEDENSSGNVRISIIKDRPSQASGRSALVNYDYKTRRIYSNEEEKNKKYSWEEYYNIEYKDNIKENLLCNLEKVVPRNAGGYEF